MLHSGQVLRGSLPLLSHTHIYVYILACDMSEAKVKV
jgi:hypothetical protein